MNTMVIMISTDSVIDSARKMSSSHAGSGMISTTMIITMPSAKPRSPRFSESAARSKNAA